ncbi:pentatricopeptide repeat-containing protein At4g21190 isoform X1 [Dendrobium catenatum]|uniref:Pentatricopeptide repeat-containing protein n=1 Tax=Dendrobium catenatum TaxID=906689 RepID=A0A2I0VBG5_9ASPA|nr:pentatricopeptide repeat-containing protein At4g21190 isoform X1 [Dendrobium catenatum]XP_020697080.1 pentatricopeptide repeat-containing protein At4g21190 isoform X1 [Dendrobium catenatum]PKU60750.1 Pentatricopeptide repeat-containing protein [Dendrobium catenatum]
MLCTIYPPSILTRIQVNEPSQKLDCTVVCHARGPRPRFPRVWKTRNRIGTISKSQKLVESIKELSNVKEEVYGALDSFIAWDLEFPLIVIKKALKTLEFQKEWKRIIQVIKWMLSKGQGQTLGTYYTLLNALAEDGRLEEAEELWTKIFSQYLESLPRVFFMKMISLYYSKGLNEKMFEVFADMEELGVRPDRSIVKMVGEVFQNLGMHDKYEKLHMKYPPPNWEYRYIKGKRVKIRVKQSSEADDIEAKSEIRRKLITGAYDDEVEAESEEEQFTGADGEVETEIVLEQLTVLNNNEDERVRQQIPVQDAG